MGLHSPCSLVTTLAELDAAGIAIVQHDEIWYISSYGQTVGQYTTPEAALEASALWLATNHTRSLDEGATTHTDRS